MPVVRSNELESETLTRLFCPLKLSAPPNLAVVVQLAPAIVPALPCPDASAVVVPVPSSKPHAATGPDGPELATVTGTGLLVARLPVGSRATAVSVWVPFAAVRVSHWPA